MKVAVVGTGYVGLITGTVLADLGNDVICVDSDASKVEKLSQGIPTIYEPGLSELLQRTLSEGYLRFTTSTADAVKASEIVFIAVGTPPGPDGTPDLTAVVAVAKAIGQAIDKHTVVVNKSTVPVGSGELVEQTIREQGAPEGMYDVVSNPEFLREGSAVMDTLHPDRIVIGAKRREAALKLVELYAALERPMQITDLNSAELIKYASNSFLAMKISFINAISQLCERCDANIGDVAKGVGQDSRIGPGFLQAGLGWGGSCFPKDVTGLIATANKMGYDFGLLQEVVKVNEEQTHRFVDRLEERLGGFAGKRIGMLGLAFKPNTDDVRDAKSLIVIDRITKGGGKVQGYDPVASDSIKSLRPEVEIVGSAYDVADGADALVLITEWNEFKQLDLERMGSCMKSRILFDGRRVYSRPVAERAGFEYHTIGSRPGVTCP